jgi:23S rRNA (uracil1939-C5)-methyltransferase
MNHTAQLAYKQTTLQETLQRMGQISASPLPMIASPEPYHYRHRAQFKLLRQGHSLKIGFYQRETHELVAIEDCLILHPEIQQAMKILHERLQDGLPFLRHPTEMHLQYSAHTGQFLIVFYSDGVKPTGLTEFYTNLKAYLPVVGMVAYTPNRRREVRGQPFLLYNLKGMTFRISDQSFAQPNWSINQIIIDQILAYAQPKGNETVLELYSGMGNFSLFLAQQARRVISLESSLQAVKDAEYNARLNQVSNLELYHCNVQEGLAQLLENPPTVDLVLLDPPRQGAGQSILKPICSLQPTKILYLSCDPTTLARDLKFLLLHGYHLGRIQPFDLLPQTYHLEVLAELQKAHQ